MRCVSKQSRDPIFLLMFWMFFGCGQGGGCGGLAPSDGFAEKDKIEIAGQLRVTQSGLDFFEENLEPILESVLPEGGLDLCIPGQGGDIIGIVEWGICTGNVCPDGQSGCALNLGIGSVDLGVLEPSSIEASLQFSELSIRIPITADPIASCSVSVDGQGFELTLPIELSTPEPNRYLNVELAGQPIYELSDLNIRLRGEGGGLSFICDAIDGVINLPLIGDLIYDALQGLLDGLLYDQLKGVFETFTCRSCEQVEDCQDYAARSCTDGLCLDADANCIIAPLGIDGRIDLGDFLSGLLMTPTAPVDILAVPGSFVNVEQAGLSMGLIAGFKSPRDRCVPPVIPPEIENFEPSTLLRGGMVGQEEDFQIGFGLTKPALDRLMWSFYNTGGLCIQVTGATISQLNTSLLGVIFPDLANLARNPRAPVAITLSPQNPPVTTFGTNTIELDDEGNPVVVDPLLSLAIEELWLDFHVFMDDRWVRFASLHTNIDLPFAIDFTDQNTLIPLLGELSQSLRDLRIENTDLLRGDNNLVVTLLPMLINVFAGGLLTDLIEPIALPPILGFELDLEGTEFTGIESGQMLAVFTSLRPSSQSVVSQVATDVRILDVHMPEYTTLPQYGLEAWRAIWVDVDVSAWDSAVVDSPMEVSYQVDGLTWSPFQPSGHVRVRSPQFLLQGVHEIRFRARRVGDYRSLDANGVVLSVRLDNVNPSLTLVREAGSVLISTTDLVSAPEDLRIHVHGPEGAVVVDDDYRFETRVDGLYSVVVVDEAGNSANAQVSVHEAALVGRPAPAAREGGGCGCNTRREQTGAPLYLLLFILGLWRPRRHICALFICMLALMALGCSDETGATKDMDEADSGVPACSESNPCRGPNEICQEGVCGTIDCQGDTECSALNCDTGSALCDPEGYCICLPNCQAACTTSQYCCHETDTCRELIDDCANSCPDGYLRDADSVVANPFECTVNQSTCTCSELPHLDRGLIGRYAALATDGSSVYVSAYAEDYGDLVVGISDTDSEIDWMWVDGVPEGAQVVAGPTGPRGGVETPGLDVGLYTDIAVASNGDLHVAYHGLEPGTLYYAFGRATTAGYEWSKTLLDEAGNSGRWASISLDLEGRPGIAYHVRYLDGVSQLRYLFAMTAAPTSRNDWAPPFLLQARPIDLPGDEAMETYPEGTGLFTTQARDSEGLPSVAWYDRSEGKLWMTRFTEAGFLAPEMIAGWGHPDAALDGDMGANVHLAIDVNDEPHLCFQDGNTDSLRYVAPTLGRSEWVDDGVWIDTGGRGQALHVVGEDCQLLFDTDNQPLIIYQDSTQQALLMRRRNQLVNDGTVTWSGRQSLRVDLGVTPRGYGFYASAVLIDDVLWVGHLVYDRSESSEGYFELINVSL